MSEDRYRLYDEHGNMPGPGMETKIEGSVPAELAHAIATKNVCGECKSFAVAEGRQVIRVTKFFERLVREENWQTKYLCSGPNDLGLCNQSSSGARGENLLLTGRMHRACDAFRPARGLVSLSRKGTDPR